MLSGNRQKTLHQGKLSRCSHSPTPLLLLTIRATGKKDVAITSQVYEIRSEHAQAQLRQEVDRKLFFHSSRLSELCHITTNNNLRQHQQHQQEQLKRYHNNSSLTSKGICFKTLTTVVRHFVHVVQTWSARVPVESQKCAFCFLAIAVESVRPSSA